jgi:tryptophan halogenase
MNNKPISFGVVGSGTAGLLSAIMLRKAFPLSPVTIISSSTIGIVGVGEGSTEHWREFMVLCDIPLEEMIERTAATHKYGIRFEGWSNVFPDYFHSVSGDETLYGWGLYPTYAGFLEAGQALTSQTSSVGLVQNKIKREGLHTNTNQYHFDTFKLNNYFTDICFKRSVKMIDGTVKDISRDANTGCITEVSLDNGTSVSADFWIDASGFQRVLMSRLNSTDWTSFSDYLLVDSAVAAPSSEDPNGIRPYTRAIAKNAGWMFEIPTRERRGNGYVFSSQFTSEDSAINELEKQIGELKTQPRTFKFDAGHLKNPWVHNCLAVGLAGAFVEPLEATSIGSTIQQLRLAIPSLASFADTHTASQRHYNKSFNIMMDNILTMIRLHYMTDKTNSEFWLASANMKVNDSLQELLDLWQERTPSRMDVSTNHGEMFHAPHLLHVAQGQGLLNPEVATRMIDNFNLRMQVEQDMSKRRHERFNHELIDHRESLNMRWENTPI